MKKRLSSIFKTTNISKLAKVILKGSYRVLQVTFKRKTLKQPIYFLKAVVSWLTFGIQSSITLAIFWGTLQKHTF